MAFYITGFHTRRRRKIQRDDEVIKWSDGEQRGGRKEGRKGRKKDEQMPLSVTFLTRANLCTERQKEEDGEMGPSEMGRAEIKEHYTPLRLKCSKPEWKPLNVSQKWWRGWGGFPLPLPVKVSIDGTIQTSAQVLLRQGGNWNKSSSKSECARFILSKRARAEQERC